MKREEGKGRKERDEDKRREKKKKKKKKLINFCPSDLVISRVENQQKGYPCRLLTNQ